MGAVGFMYPPIENQYFSCHIYLMIITQTVYIQADRRIFLDLPPELPVGKAKVAVIPQIEKPIDNTYEATVKLRDLAKKMGSTLTVERFLEMEQEDLRIEENQSMNYVFDACSLLSYLNDEPSSDIVE